MRPDDDANDVRIVDFEETRVAVLEHRGDPNLTELSVRRFIDWRRQNHLPPSASATFNIVYDDPDARPADDYRLDICAAIDRPVGENATGVVEKTIPGGRCAVLRHVGSPHALGEPLRYLLATWLPASGLERRDFPLFLQRVRFGSDVPEQETVTDVFLPLR